MRNIISVFPAASAAVCSISNIHTNVTSYLGISRASPKPVISCLHDYGFLVSKKNRTILSFHYKFKRFVQAEKGCKMGKEDDGPPSKKQKTDDTLPECPYGSRCYRKNPKHFEEFSHPKDTKADTISTDTSDSLSTPSTSNRGSIDTSSLPPCKYGATCYRKNLLHFAEYSHPFQVCTLIFLQTWPCSKGRSHLQSVY